MSTVPAIVFAPGLTNINPLTRPQFTGIQFRNAWSSIPAYFTWDVVTSGGSAWIALQPNSNVLPGTDINTWVVLVGGAGVTSVAISVPALLTVSNSPITTSGTIALALATQAAATIFSGPTSGGAATPTFRAMVPADIIPALSVTDAGVGSKTQVAVFGRTGAAPSTTERAVGIVFADANNAAVVAGVAGIRNNSNVDYNGSLGLYVSNVGSGGGAANLTALTEGARLDNLGNFTAIGKIKASSDMSASRSATSGYIFFGTDAAVAIGRATNDLDLFGYTGVLFNGNTTGQVLRGNGTRFVSAQLALSDCSGTVTAGQLPNPSASTLGGVQSKAAAAHNFLTSISTAGVPALAQPAAADLSDGVTGTGTVVMSTSPTIATPSISSPTLTGTTAVKRIRATQATALVAGDFALSAGWGSTATVTGVIGTDMGWTITINCAGSGIAANAFVTLTFKDGTFTNNPIYTLCRGDGNSPLSGIWINSTTATTLTLTFVGTPITATGYVLSGIGMGR